MKKTLKSLRSACVFAVAMIVICGLVYPLALTGIAQVLFHNQANGSLIEIEGNVVGSTLVGQDFDDARFFKARPSAYNYNTYTTEEKENGTYAGVASGSNNYAPSNPALKERINQDIETFLRANPQVNREDIPVDFVSASGSGLDPHISVEAAQIQVAEIAKESGLTTAQLQEIIDEYTSDKVLGIFGQETVNVVECNIAIAQKIGLL